MDELDEILKEYRSRERIEPEDTVKSAIKELMLKWVGDNISTDCKCEYLNTDCQCNFMALMVNQTKQEIRDRIKEEE